jgi:holo-ACP synthase / triphosphoribosyl-dephospho-CoA synthase
MFEATKGVNTHKGMIFCLAVLCGAIGRIKAQDERLTCKNLQTQIKALCHNLLEDDLVHVNAPNSAGARFFYETKSGGIREIAQSGFAIVFEIALPFFKASVEQEGEERALQKTLLLLMSRLDDSTLWSRGGMEGLTYTKTKAAALLHVNMEHEKFEECLRVFDTEMIEKNLSPGGSADLLAMTWLLSKISIA